MTIDQFSLDPGARTVLADLGINPALVMRRARLPTDLLSRTPVTLSTAEYYAFWAALEDEAALPNLPIALAGALRVEAFQPAIFAALCSPDLRVAAERIAAHKRLVGPLRLEVMRSDEGLSITTIWPPGPTPPSVLVLVELLFWVALARIATRSDVRPLRVTTPDPPEHREAYRTYLGVAIQPGPSTTVTFSRLDAGRPFLTADEAMWQFFEPELRQRLSDLDGAATTEERVRAALMEQLPTGDATMETVARHLHVSVRTLQRRLQDEQTTFQVVLNATRESLARHYLQHSSMPAAEISFLLGYNDANSFYRAFQSWTGHTPQRVRAATR